jgi:2-methylcitrate dehydratase PrpD
MSSNATKALAEFAHDVTRDDLPDHVVAEVRRMVIDTIAVSYAAVDHESVHYVIDLVTSMGSAPQASVWGSNFRLSLADAALVNGQLSHVDCFGETFFSTPTTFHGCPAVLPAAFGLAEALEATEDELILAIAVAYEVQCRVALSAGWEHHRRPWHVTGTVGPYGSAIAAGKLLGLEPGQLVHAMGLGAAQFLGFIAPLGSMTLPFVAGTAARNGVIAAMLAQRGMTSSEDILTGKHGFHAVVDSARDVGYLTRDLGSEWNLHRVGYKPFSCGSNLFAVIGASIALREEFPGDANDVASLHVRVNPHLLVPTGKTESELRTGLDGKFSVPHAAAVAFIDGDAGPPQFTDARVRDPTVTALRNRVSLIPDEQVRRDEAIMTIEARDGTAYEHHMTYAPGITPGHPMTDEELVRKLLSFSQPLAGEAQAIELADALQHLGGTESVRPLAERLSTLGRDPLSPSGAQPLSTRSILRRPESLRH